MSGTRRDALSQRVRMYSVALGFVLGQIGPLATLSPRQPPAIVRTRTSDLDDRGFDGRERLNEALILTTPHVLREEDDTAWQAPRATERGWIQNN